MAKHSLSFSLALAAVCGCGGGGPTPRTHSLQQFCALATACFPLEGNTASFGECIRVQHERRTTLRRADSSASLVQLSQRDVDCASAAFTCDEMQACSRPTPAQVEACDATKTGTCSGNVMLSCRDRQDVLASDCGKVGQICGSSPTGAMCGLAACDPSTTKPRCEGNLLFSCLSQGNVLTSDDCAKSGRVCGKRSEGSMGCVGTVPCGPTYDLHCEGTTVVRCEFESESRYDCSALGADWTCEAKQNDGKPTIDCVPVAKECTIGVGESCSDGVIRYCEAGRVATYDCKSAGLSGCTAPTKDTAICVK